MSADQAAVVAAIRSNDRFVVVTHENPDGDALGSMLATTLGLRALGKDASMYLTGTAPMPAEYALPRARRALAHAARRSRASACCSPSTAPTSAASARPRPASTRASSWSTSTTITTTTASATSTLIDDRASSTAEIVRDILRELDVALTPEIAAGALRRARHRHGTVPVLEHDAEGARAGGRARRGGRRRARGLPARLRDGAVREAEAARAGARARAAVRGRRPRRLVPAAGRLRRGRRRGAVLGGHHRPPARRSRARRWSR